MKSPFLTLSEAAEHLRVHKRTIRREIDAGRLPRYLFRSKILVRRDELEALLK